MARRPAHSQQEAPPRHMHKHGRGHRSTGGPALTQPSLSSRRLQSYLLLERQRGRIAPVRSRAALCT
eukprot:8242820-Alexandrium_andersonii.AAC.1